MTSPTFAADREQHCWGGAATGRHPADLLLRTRPPAARHRLAAQRCGMADVTLKQGIERMIREEVLQVIEIVDVTDHAAGQNPYVTASKK